jgi:hypothetical protein
VISAEEDVETSETDDRDDPVAWMSRPAPFGPACRAAPAGLFFTPDYFYADEVKPGERPVRDSRGHLIEYDEDGERIYPLPEESVFCRACPVHTECLAYGITTDQPGVWGGMTRYQRRQLGRRRTRVSCPSCAGRFIVVEGSHQLCLACGVSWTYVRSGVR